MLLAQVLVAPRAGPGPKEEAEAEAPAEEEETAANEREEHVGACETKSAPRGHSLVAHG
jgi:hypothetical protein